MWGYDGVEIEQFACNGVVESQSQGVQTQSHVASSVGLTSAIFAIAHDGVADVAHVYANLVLSSGKQFEFEQCGIIALLQ